MKKAEAMHLGIEARGHEGAMGRVETLARAQQVGGQAACQLHLVLNVAIIVEVPVEAIPARGISLVTLHPSLSSCNNRARAIHLAHTVKEQQIRLISRQLRWSQ